MPFLRKYNTLLVTGTTAIQIPIIKRGSVDFAVGADWTPATGDVKILVDNTSAANVTNLPTAKAGANTGAIWEFVLTAAELSCKQCVIIISDAATKAIEDQCFIVETFGNASAMYAADFSLANLPANVTQLLGTAWLTPGTAGTPDVNVKLISADATAADNAEAFFDGTGYAGTNNVIPLVTFTSTASAVTAISSGGIAAASFAAGAIDNAAIAANAIGASELATDAVNEIADGLLDRADAVETGVTIRKAHRIEVAAAAGKLSGAATTTVVIRDTTDAKDRITATVDANGNRSAVTLDLT